MVVRGIGKFNSFVLHLRIGRKYAFNLAVTDMKLSASIVLHLIPGFLSQDLAKLQNLLPAGACPSFGG